MKKLRILNSAVATICAVLLSVIFTAGSSPAAVDDAPSAQYNTATTDGTQTEAPQIDVSDDTGAATVAGEDPAPAPAAPVQNIINQAPPETVTVPSAPADEAPAVAAAGMSSKLFLLLGSAAASTSIMASVMAIIRGRK